MRPLQPTCRLSHLDGLRAGSRCFYYSATGRCRGANLSFQRGALPARHFASYLSVMIEMLKSCIWFTTINLKDVYFHVVVALKHRKFLHFAFWGVDYKYNRLLFIYLLAFFTFSWCLEVELKPLHDQGMDLVLPWSHHLQGQVQGVGYVSDSTSLGWDLQSTWRRPAPP